MHAAAVLRLLPFLVALPLLGAQAPPSPRPDRLAPFFQPDRLRALILSGRNNHDWRSTTPVLKGFLLDSGRFEVRVNEMVDGLGPETLAPFDVLVMDYGGPRWPAATEQAVEAFVQRGGGLVLVHGAVYHFSGLPVLTDGHRAVAHDEAPWIAFRQMAGVGWEAPPPGGYHGTRHRFEITLAVRDHPITASLPPTLPADDELYQGLSVLPSARILATAFAPPDQGGTGRDEPMLVIHTYGTGRVFTTVLGHDAVALSQPAFRHPFVRGTEWAARGTVAPEPAPAR